MANLHPKDNIGCGVKGRGRPKGALNKTTRTVMEAISYAAEGLGGADRLVDWAKEDPANERAFWSNIYPKLLPIKVQGDPDKPIEHRHTHNMAYDASEMLNKIRGT